MANKKLIDNLDYVRQCMDRAILQETGKMEKLGRWYTRQQISDAKLALDRAFAINEEGTQIELFK